MFCSKFKLKFNLSCAPIDEVEFRHVPAIVGEGYANTMGILQHGAQTVQGQREV
jgi:hypothetical protein